MRTIRIDFTGYNRLPDGCVLGYIGEHNATQIKITPPEEMTSTDAIACFYVVFQTGGLLIRSDKITDADNISVTLSVQLTMDKHMKIQLEGCDGNDNVLMKSPLVSGLCFLSSAAGTEKEYDKSLSPVLASTFRGFEFVEVGDENIGVKELNVYNVFPASTLNTGCMARKINLINVSEVASGQFQTMSYLEEILGTENLESLQTNLFYNCQKLKSININPEITDIPSQCFMACAALETITGTDNITSIGTRAFQNDTSLTEVSLPECKKYYDYAFLGCTNLTIPDITEEFENIGKSSFNGCKNLEILSVKCTGSIGQSAFYSCSSIKNIEIECGNIGTYVFASCTGLESAVLKGSTRPMGYMFQNCTALKTVTFETTPDSIPTYCFDGCSSLDIDEITANTILSYAFRNSGLTSVTINAQIIGQYAFYGCNGLTSVTINDGCSTIQNLAFSQTAITNLQLPASVQSLLANSLSGITALKTVNVPGVTAFTGSSTFSGDTGLQNVTLGSAGHGVTSVISTAFSGCTQSGLKISIYKNDTSTPLSYQPWGATNATIEYLQA